MTHSTYFDSSKMLMVCSPSTLRASMRSRPASMYMVVCTNGAAPPGSRCSCWMPTPAAAGRLASASAHASVTLLFGILIGWTPSPAPGRPAKNPTRFGGQGSMGQAPQHGRADDGRRPGAAEKTKWFRQTLRAHPAGGALRVIPSGLQGGGPGRAPLLVALAAVDGPPLGRLEGNGGLFTALRANGDGFYPLVGTALAQSLIALGLAGFAAPGFVLEALVGEKHLLAGRPHELGTAVHTNENLVLELHP